MSSTSPLAFLRCGVHVVQVDVPVNETRLQAAVESLRSLGAPVAAMHAFVDGTVTVAPNDFEYGATYDIQNREDVLALGDADIPLHGTALHVPSRLVAPGLRSDNDRRPCLLAAHYELTRQPSVETFIMRFTSRSDARGLCVAALAFRVEVPEGMVVTEADIEMVHTCHEDIALGPDAATWFRTRLVRASGLGPTLVWSSANDANVAAASAVLGVAVTYLSRPGAAHVHAWVVRLASDGGAVCGGE